MNRQTRVRDLDGPIDPMSHRLLNVISEGVLEDHRRVDLKQLNQLRGGFDVNEGPPRALLNAAGVGIPFPYARLVGNGASVFSRERSVRDVNVLCSRKCMNGDTTSARQECW